MLLQSYTKQQSIQPKKNRYCHSKCYSHKHYGGTFATFNKLHSNISSSFQRYSVSTHNNTSFRNYWLGMDMLDHEEKRKILFLHEQVQLYVQQYIIKSEVEHPTLLCSCLIAFGITCIAFIHECELQILLIRSVIVKLIPLSNCCYTGAQWSKILSLLLSFIILRLHVW